MDHDDRALPSAALVEAGGIPRPAPPHDPVEPGAAAPRPPAAPGAPVLRQLGRLAEHGNLLDQSTDPGEVLRQAIDVLIDLMAADAGAVMSIRHGRATLVAVHGMSGFRVGWSCAVEQLGAREAVTSRLPVSGREIRSLAQHADADLWPVSSFCAAPVLVDGEVIGLLYALRRRTALFGPEDTSVLSLLAGQTSAAAQRAHTVTGLEERRRQAEAMRDIIRGLGSTLQTDAVLQRFSAALLDATGAERASVLLLDEDGRYLRPASCVHADPADGGVTDPLAADAVRDDAIRDDTAADREAALPAQTPLERTGAIRTVIDQRRPLTVRLRGDDRDSFGPVYQPAPDTAVLLIHPLQVHEDVLGVVVLEQSSAEPLAEATLDLVDQIATVAAVSLQHAELYEGMQRGRAQLRALHDVTLAISATDDLPSTLQQITGAALRLTGATRCRLGLKQPGGYRLAAVTGDTDLAGTVYGPSVGVGGWIIQTARPAWMPDLVQGVSEPPEALQFVRRLEGSCVAVPLRNRAGGAVGFLSLHHPDAGHFRHEVMALLERFAAEAVLAVDNDADARARRQLEERLRDQAHHDSLTGLANRALLLDRLDAALRRSRDVGSVGVLYLDLDRFKTINDSLGHTGGDELLVGVAKRLLAVVRPADLVARLGGDEFVVLVTDGVEPEALATLAERILAALGQPVRVGGAPVFVSASIGVVSARGTRRDSGQVLRDADVAMYQAKAAGKNRHAVFSAEMRTRAVGRLPIETELREAVDADQLLVHYQPIVNLAGDRMAGVEALVRWPHPERGLVPPDEFIPIAEETGLVARIDDWVLRTAARQVRAWQLRHGRPDLDLNVNLSAVSLGEDHLTDRIAAALQDADLPARCLVVELTETATMRDPQQSLSVFQQLGALGVRIAIDDFGTGYSNLGYLRRLPVNCLKIDREFISLIGQGDNGEPIVRAMLALGKAMGLWVTAEGVETELQADWLREQACDRGQGWYYGKPLDAAGTEALLGTAASAAG